MGETSDLWRVDEGWMPLCPVGSIVWFVNEGESARLFCQGSGQVGTLFRNTTSQTASSDGSSITLINRSEGWQAKLSRVAASRPTPPPGLPARVPDQWVRTPGWQAEVDAASRADIIVRRYHGDRQQIEAAYALDAAQMRLAGWEPVTAVYEQAATGGNRYLAVRVLSKVSPPPGSLVVTYRPQNRQD